MAKYSGTIGFFVTSETVPGVWKQTIVDRQYRGDELNCTYRWDSEQSTPNDSMRISNRISVISDSFLINNIPAMKYITYKGFQYKIASVETVGPRLIITLGGIFDGNATSAS